MITKITGTISRVFEEELRLTVGPYEYQILVAESIRMKLQAQLGHEITLHVLEYYEGNQSTNRIVPRKIGFLTEDELAFFELFCTVEKIGVKKALKAMARSVPEIATAIARGDATWLATLPGIGAATAEQMVTKLKRKVSKLQFAEAENPANRSTMIWAEEAFEALISLGLGPAEARKKIDLALQQKKEFTSTTEALEYLFKN